MGVLTKVCFFMKFFCKINILIVDTDTIKYTWKDRLNA